MTIAHNENIKTPLQVDPLFIISIVIVVFGIILEPSLDSVSFLDMPFQSLLHKALLRYILLGLWIDRSVVFAFHFDLQTSLQMHLGGIPISIFSLYYMCKNF